ncbi:MAG: hypothetical protein OXI34_14720 [Chloroflexota bacterium]|nr:hypothetical protein [Chloroflexota bacterium]MDE2946841.1 hypothetical protein [Chloroflexota bacterium]
MKHLVLMVVLVCLLLTYATVSAQQDDDPIIVAYQHYIDEVTRAANDFDRCLPASSYRVWEVNSYYDVGMVDLLGHVSNDVRDVNADTEVLICELAFNSRMIMLQIEVQLILAGIDRAILEEISR